MKMGVPRQTCETSAAARRLGRVILGLCATALLSVQVRAQCTGDCNGDGMVGINELILAVNIASGTRNVADCPNADANGNGMVAINELVSAVNHALNGCPPPALTPTPTEFSDPTPTATVEPKVGPQIRTFALLAADDTLVMPTTFEGNVPVYQLPFGRAFRIVVEASPGESGIFPGSDTFRAFGAPSFQIQSNRPLGNGSPEVCDGDSPVPGGVPGIDPPSFELTPMVEDALNDLGCRFLDGSPMQQPAGRGCNDQQACLRFEDGTFGCASPAATIQYCSRIISAIEEFPVGDTLLTARVMECRLSQNCPLGRPVPLAGPTAQLVVRVQPPFPG